MTLFVPPALLPPAGDGKDAHRFILASSEWVDLQNRVQSLLALPSDIGEYEERYGDASAARGACFGAMRRLQQPALRYGNPKRLRTRLLNNPALHEHAERPRNDAFSATVWTLGRVRQDASALARALGSIPGVASDHSAPVVCEGIRSLFLGPGQIVERMQQSVTLLDMLLGEFQALEGELESAQLAMKAFTDRNCKTRTNLDQEIGALGLTIAKLDKARDTAYDKWLTLTMSACAVPATMGIVGIAAMVVLATPAGGGSFAVGPAASDGSALPAAGALRAAAGVARTAYAELVASVHARDESLARRACFRSDLGALDDLMKYSVPASSGVMVQLGAIRNGWADSIARIAAGVNQLGAASLRTSGWLDETHMSGAAASWRQLDSALAAFAPGSFVDADLIDFGSELPQDDAGWQRGFALRRAA